MTLSKLIFEIFIKPLVNVLFVILLVSLSIKFIKEGPALLGYFGILLATLHVYIHFVIASMKMFEQKYEEFFETDYED